MEKIDWNYEKIKERYGKMKRSIRRYNALDDNYNITLNNYMEMLSQKNDGTDFEKTCFSNTDLDYFKKYIKYLDKDISSLILELTRTFGYKAISSDGQEIELGKVNVSNDDLKYQAYTFFGHLGDFDKALDKIFKNGLIKVIDVTSCESLFGQTYLDLINHLGYAFVYNTSDVNVYSTFNHELFHIIEQMKNPKLHDDTALLFLEARTTFIDFLTQYKRIKDNPYTDHTDEFNVYKNSKIFANYCLKSIEIANFLSYYDDLNPKQMVSRLKGQYNDKLDLKGNNIDIYDPVDAINFFMSYLVAIHLLNVYIEDEEKGIYLFNKALHENPNHNFKYLKSLEFDPKNKDYISDLYNTHGKLFKKGIAKTRMRQMSNLYTE